MGRNSKDNSLTRYEEMLKVSVRYLDYLKHPRLKIAFSSGARKRLNVAAHYVASVKTTLAKLDKKYRDLLVNEFFTGKHNELWWTKHYSKSTYYRDRYFAIKAFTEAFNL